MDLRRELAEELGLDAAKLANMAVELPVPYCFGHTSPERAQKHGTKAEEHHFFIAPVPDGLEFKFCEDRLDPISVVWITQKVLLNLSITRLTDMKEFNKKHIIAAI